MQRKVVSLKSNNGFTMIELLMVIIIVGSLSASAVPNFIDFRDHARRAAMQAMLNSLRMGMKNQIQNMQLRCGAPVGAIVSRYALEVNDVVAAAPFAWQDRFSNAKGTCTAEQVTNPADRRILDTGTTMPNNPFTNSNGIYTDGTSAGTVCNTIVPGYGWCYHTESGILSPNSDVIGEASL